MANIFMQGKDPGHTDFPEKKTLLHPVLKRMMLDSSHSTNFRYSADDAFHGTCPRDEDLKAGLAIGKLTIGATSSCIYQEM